MNTQCLIPDDIWETDPEFPRKDWRQEVGEESTQLGYWDWVEHQKEALVIEWDWQIKSCETELDFSEWKKEYFG